MLFREYMQDYEQIKQMVIGILDPDGDTIDHRSKSVLNRELSEFKRRDDLLKDVELSDIITKRKNRAAIIQAIENNTTTIGNLLSLLSRE